MDNIFPNEKSAEEHKYTSTGVKFWRHPEAMVSYREKTGNTIISTHISPEGACNLSCPYCSVSKRLANNRINLDTIKNYVLKLKKRGLKAVILTGGGEPTLYPHFNELVSWLKYEQGLSVALITNGTLTNRVDKELWGAFSWVRISINFFEGFRDVIRFPEISGVLGASMVFTGQSLNELKEISKFVRENVSYVRVLPNCLLSQEDLIHEHMRIKELLSVLDDKRFFQQFKIHGRPCSSICHQAYFRPYLSEVNGGTVFPCDSLVLNNEQKHFNEKYAICRPEEIEDFLDGKIKLKFDAREACAGCVFTDNIKLLDMWTLYGENKFEHFTEELLHEEFV